MAGLTVSAGVPLIDTFTGTFAIGLSVRPTVNEPEEPSPTVSVRTDVVMTIGGLVMVTFHESLAVAPPGT